ncbi:hypothetical protein FHS79_002133 [Polymorphobacter multimanifer]|uniref:Histidine phosphotransferase ChpT C-terminal domain-containing protein n=1 Tax=Polymorphobacter multimanifer TaxID=1070431 RepID=A0A841L8P2_9SPHN|nr:hypothetical protein [Polymorphobacter multimanifer]MBB6227951.1 hypothetical protein [Polymorphobacter multimanifer]
MSETITENQAALVVRWLCHDMATPVATLLTASELLGDTGDAEINGLITAAIRKLSARLRLVRLALGAAGNSMNAAALAKLLGEGLPDTPLALDLDGNPDLPASLVSGVALILSDISRTAPLAIDPAGARWTNDHPLPDTAARALDGNPEADGRSAMIGLIAAHARSTGWALQAQGSGVAFVQA